MLGITSIDPIHSELLFERFISQERNEPPDIDVDFEHERREEVIQWIYDTYGRTRAALTAVVICYRTRGAVREVGKALGVPEDVTSALSGLVRGWSTEGVSDNDLKDLNLNLDDPRLRLTLELSRDLIGAPRHLSQHPGGFVLTQDRLDDLVPIEPAAMENRQVIEWDKNDIEILKFMKVDVLGLGMLGCMRRSFELLQKHKNTSHDLASIPQDDPETYEMICRADTLGVFQIESRAQMAMLPRLKPRDLYDLVIEVAIVRPGPIQGDMVHPYIRRREGREEVSYPIPEAETSARQDARCPAVSGAGYARRHRMRRLHALGGRSAAPGHGNLQGQGRRLEIPDQAASGHAGARLSAGIRRAHLQATRRLRLLWLSRKPCRLLRPDRLCLVLDEMPPSGCVLLAPSSTRSPWASTRRRRSFAMPGSTASRCGRSMSIISHWDCTLERTRREDRFALRLGLRMAKGLSEADGEAIVQARGGKPFASIEDLWLRAKLHVAPLERLAEADAFGSLGLNRRDALWKIKGLGDTQLALFTAADERDEQFRPEAVEPEVSLTPMKAGREVVEDYLSKGLTLRRHPVAFLREELTRRRIIPCADLKSIRHGQRITVAGLVLVRQKPGSAKGVMFMTIEDETDVANLVIWTSLYEKHRRLILSSGMIGCRGRLQREGDVTHLVAEYLIDLSDLLRSVANRDDAPHLSQGPGSKEPIIKVATRDFR